MAQEHEHRYSQGQEQQEATGRRARRRRFSKEFKRDAVDMVVSSGRPISHVAAELDLHDSTLGNWVRQWQIDQGEREA